MWYHQDEASKAQLQQTKAWNVTTLQWQKVEYVVELAK